MARQEVYDGEKWIAVGTSGTVTAVEVEGGEGIEVSGSPIVESGTINISLSETLQNLSSLSEDGFVVKDGANSYGRNIIAGSGVVVTDGDGKLGDAVISRPPVVLSGAVSGIESIPDGVDRKSNNTGIIGIADFIETTLNNTQNISSDEFIFNYLNNSSNYSFNHYLDSQDNVSNTFQHRIGIKDESDEYRGWSQEYSIGAKDSVDSRFTINYEHPLNTNKYTPFSISIENAEPKVQISANLNMADSRITNVADPVDPKDAVNKAYVDDTSGRRLSSNDFHMESDLDMENHKILNIKAPMTLISDEASKAYVKVKSNNSAAENSSFWVESNEEGSGAYFGYNNLYNYGFLLTIGSHDLLIGTNIGTQISLRANNNQIDVYSYFDMNSNKITNLPSPTASSDAATKEYVDSQSGSSSNTVSGKFTCTESSKQIYMRASSSYLSLRGDYVRNSKPSAIIETNSYNETAAIVMNGDYIQTIQTFDDLGFIFTDEDSDPTTSYKSYISSSGTLVTSSSKNIKQSIRPKQKKNYLERLNKLNVYSYALKSPIYDSDSTKTKCRKYFKNKQLHIGLLSEEVNELFDNATDSFKTITISSENEDEIKKTIGDFKPDISEEQYIKDKNDKRGKVTGVKYDTLLCYTILAIQELTKRLEKLEEHHKQS